MSKAKEIVGNLLKQVFKPRVKVTPSEWVEQNIRLAKKTSIKDGAYRLLHTPYLRKLYDDIGNPRVRKIVVKKAAQLGLTQYANNVLLFYVCNFALPLLMVMPSKEAAQQFCERSLTPSIHACRAVKEYLTGKEDDLKKTEFLFTSCIARVIGAGSPSKLASNPAAVVIVDECDKQEDFSSQGEAPALELAEDRTISFPDDKKIVVLSTPTTENTSVVHAEWLKGSQSKYFVACPHCRHEQVLEWQQVWWPEECKVDGEWDIDRVEREARYKCVKCQAKLTEQHKIDMVRQGEWRDTNTKPYPAEIRSYQISALYSFNVTWGGMAKLFLLAKNDAGKLRNFYNSYLGECFQQQEATISTSDVDKLVETSKPYKRGEIPGRPRTILFAADTQDDSFWWVAQAVYDTHAAVIDWGEAATFEDLLSFFKQQYPIQDTEEYQGAFKAVIDAMGHRTQDVYNFCLKTGLRFLPLMGRGGMSGTHYRQEPIKHKGHNLPLLRINDRAFKDLLYLSIIQQNNGELLLPQDIDDNLRKQLSSERLVQVKDGFEWRCTNRNNHLGDCCKYLEAFKQFYAPQLRAARAREETAVVMNEQPKREYVLRPPAPAYSNGWD